MDNNIAAKINAAKNEGYADEDILQYLMEQPDVGFKVKSAIEAGHTPGDILTYLSTPPEPTTGEKFKRDAGLTTRAVVQAIPQAVLGVPAMVGDAYDSLTNLTKMGLNATGIPALKSDYVPTWRNTKAVGDFGTYLADTLGLPAPQSEGEKRFVRYGTDIGGAVGGAGLAKTIATKAAPGVTKQVFKELGTNPGQQAVAVGATNYAGNYLADNPEFAESLGPGGQTTMLLGAGIVAPGAAGGTANALRRSAGVISPFSTAGQRGIAGTILRRTATDPETAVRNLLGTDLLPGSRMTTPELAGDPGLAGAAQPIFKTMDETNKAGARASERNAVRVRELERLAGANPKVNGDGATVKEYAEAKRAAVTTPMREEAFAQATVDPDTLNTATTLAVDGTINRILKSEVGTREDVQKSMQWVKGRLQQDINTPERLYSLRKDLREASMGKYSQDNPSLKLAKGQLEEVIQSVDDVIEAAAPGYKAYMNKYQRMSVPIDQMEIADHLRRAASSASVDVTRSGGAAAQFPVLMAGKLKSALESAKVEKEWSKMSVTQKTLVDKIFADLRSEMSVTGGNRMVRQPGSDTFKNMSMSNFMGRVVGQKLAGTEAAKSISGPLGWLYKLPDNQIQDLLVDAMLDPKLARELMLEATDVRIQKMGEALKNKAVAAGMVQSADDAAAAGER